MLDLRGLAKSRIMTSGQNVSGSAPTCHVLSRGRLRSERPASLFWIKDREVSLLRGTQENI